MTQETAGSIPVDHPILFIRRSITVYKCASHCVCGLQLVLCELDVVVNIRGKHREKYGLPYPKSQWVSRCRRCGRHYLVDGHGNPGEEHIELYPYFLYHSIISWNQLRRREGKLPPVSPEELGIYWGKYVPELAWDAAMINAFETDREERSIPSRSRRSFVYGAAHCDLREDATFRTENDLALPIPHLTR